MSRRVSQLLLLLQHGPVSGIEAPTLCALLPTVRPQGSPLLSPVPPAALTSSAVNSSNTGTPRGALRTSIYAPMLRWPRQVWHHEYVVRSSRMLNCFQLSIQIGKIGLRQRSRKTDCPGTDLAHSIQRARILTLGRSTSKIGLAPASGDLALLEHIEAISSSKFSRFPVNAISVAVKIYNRDISGYLDYGVRINQRPAALVKHPAWTISCVCELT